MNNILITGTAGFIGFNLAKKLIQDKNNKIIGIDNLNDYYDPLIKEKRNNILLTNSNYIFYKEDLKNFEKIKNIIAKEKPEIMIHLAAQAGVRYSITNPHAYETANNLGTLNIFESAKLNNIKRVIFASSSSVYGNPINTPSCEEDDTEHPISLYAASKKSNEVLAYSYHHLYGIEMAGMRFFTVYGKFGRPDMAMFKFVKNIILDKEINLYNQGDMKRGFTYVEDIVAGIIGIMNKKELKYEIYNIGGHESVTLKYFVSLIEKNLGKQAKIKLLPMQPGDVYETYANTSKLNKDVGFKPKTSIEEGIKIFCDWFVENEDWLLKLKDAKQ